MQNDSERQRKSTRCGGDESCRRPGWMSPVLLVAAIYNVVWGGWVVLFPEVWFRFLGLAPPMYLELWQCIGMIVGCYGVGYAVASLNPVRYWPVVLVGLLGKVFGPIGFAWALIQGSLPLAFGWMIVFNDLIWWVPFAGILVFVYRVELGNLGEKPGPDLSRLSELETDGGRRILEQSAERPVLLVFLRHLGCTFSREVLSDLKKAEKHLEQKDVYPVVIHMSTPGAFEQMCRRFHLDNWDHLSDPERTWYRRFGLPRGTWNQLFGLEVWKRGWEAGISGQCGVGFPDGDGFQMPGIFLVEHGEITRAFHPRHAGERLPLESFLN